MELYALGTISTPETCVSITAAQAIHTLYMDESTRCAVNQMLKSVMGEIRMAPSVEVGAPIG